jgi:hypothetical protein
MMNNIMLNLSGIDFGFQDSLSKFSMKMRMAEKTLPVNQILNQRLIQ